jgi:hypothetical protein
MIWVETINIRTAGIIEAGKVLDLCREILESIAFETALRLKVFCSTKYTTDISIHLQWKSDPGPSSVLASQLISALGDFGLISHSIWIEQEIVATCLPEDEYTEQNQNHETCVSERIAHPPR